MPKICLKNPEKDPKNPKRNPENPEIMVEKSVYTLVYEVHKVGHKYVNIDNVLLNS